MSASSNATKRNRAIFLLVLLSLSFEVLVHAVDDVVPDDGSTSIPAKRKRVKMTMKMMMKRKRKIDKTSSPVPNVDSATTTSPTTPGPTSTQTPAPTPGSTPTSTPAPTSSTTQANKRTTDTPRKTPKPTKPKTIGLLQQCTERCQKNPPANDCLIECKGCTVPTCILKNKCAQQQCIDDCVVHGDSCRLDCIKEMNSRCYMSCSAGWNNNVGDDGSSCCASCHDANQVSLEACYADCTCKSPTATCMNQKNFNQCKQLVAQGCEKILVMESCPLQFMCQT